MSSPVIVHVICEGQTELHFVIQVLAPYMQDRGLLLLPSLIGDTGGHVTFARLLRDVKACIHQQGHYVTTLLDYYGLAGDWVGLDAPATAAATEKALRLEEATSARMAGEFPSGVAYRFIPYFAMHEFEGMLFSEMTTPRSARNFAMHEFEGMLFSDPAVLAEILAVETQAVQAVVDAFTTPEDINCGPETAPSKLILHLNGRYNKVLDGPDTAELVGIDTIRARCLHFHAWLTRLEALVPGKG